MRPQLPMCGFANWSLFNSNRSRAAETEIEIGLQRLRLKSTRLAICGSCALLPNRHPFPITKTLWTLGWPKQIGAVNPRRFAIVSEATTASGGGDGGGGGVVPSSA